MKPHLLFVALVSCALLSGCASYVTPGGRADLTAITQPAIAEGFAAKPAAHLPAGVAFARIQAPKYENAWTRDNGGVWGYGRFSVVTVREVEDEADLARLAELPQLNGPIGLSTMLLPRELNSELPLRQAAARLQADMIVLYTFDTTFRERDRAAALSLVTLGVSPTRRINVHVTASALIVDTRTGFIYAALESTEKRELNSNVWESAKNADDARREAERAAFTKLVGEFESVWARVIEQATPAVGIASSR